MTLRTLALTGAAALVLSSAAFAQMAPSNSAPPPAKKPGLLSRILHRHPAATVPMSGSGAYGQHPMTHTYGQPPMGTPYGQPPMGHAYGRHRMGGMTSPFGGGIVGNKNTHVYHLPGDTGSMPAAQNRVYFHSAAQAEAAGYHAAGSGRTYHMQNAHGRTNGSLH